MAVKIRLARGGKKKAPYYKIVVASSTAPRDGDFVEKIGTYNPLLENSADKVTLKRERVEYWLSVGAQPTDRVIVFFKNAGIELPDSVQKHYEVKLKNRTNKPSKKEAKAA